MARPTTRRERTTEKTWCRQKTRCALLAGSIKSCTPYGSKPYESVRVVACPTTFSRCRRMRPGQSAISCVSDGFRKYRATPDPGRALEKRLVKGWRKTQARTGCTHFEWSEAHSVYESRTRSSTQILRTSVRPSVIPCFTSHCRVKSISFFSFSTSS